MPDPAASVYLGVLGYAWLWAMAMVSFYLFGTRVWRYAGVLRGARPEKRWDRLPERFRRFAAQVLGQQRLREEPLIGLAHLVIFWAFVVYAAGFFWNLVRGLLPFLPVPYADDVRWMALALAGAGFIGLAALAVAAVRRYAFPPPRLEQSPDAAVILALIGIVLVSWLTGWFARPRLPALAIAMWWLHMATVLGFLAYLPYSKHLHLLASPFGVFFSALQPGGMPAPSEGASRRQEFTWRQLFSGLACAECGRCDRACPAFQSGASLSPKMLMHQVKELVRAPSDGAFQPEGIWACTTCYACMSRCPVFNEHLPLVIELRRRLVSQGEIDARLQEALTNLGRYGNSFGQSPRNRAKWTQGLDFHIKDARKEPVEFLWFVGDYASYDPRLADATRAAARVFQAAGLDFGILYDGEQNAGNDVRRAGEEGLFEVLAEKNRKTLAKARFSAIVTTDPHSYHVLKHEYPAVNGGFRVWHAAELLDTLLRDGKLSLQQTPPGTATYHDPCYLGRYNGVYAQPRRILGELGVGFQEMPRNREHAWCCGAGGGKIWMEDLPPASGPRERPAESRLREAASLAGVDTLVVACPKDLVMFQDAAKTTGLADRIAVKDLMEVTEQAIAPAREKTHA